MANDKIEVLPGRNELEWSGSGFSPGRTYNVNIKFAWTNNGPGVPNPVVDKPFTLGTVLLKPGDYTIFPDGQEGSPQNKKAGDAFGTFILTLPDEIKTGTCKFTLTFSGQHDDGSPLTASINPPEWTVAENLVTLEVQSQGGHALPKRVEPANQAVLYGVPFNLFWAVKSVRALKSITLKGLPPNADGSPGDVDLNGPLAARALVNGVAPITLTGTEKKELTLSLHVRSDGAGPEVESTLASIKVDAQPAPTRRERVVAEALRWHQDNLNPTRPLPLPPTPAQPPAPGFVKVGTPTFREYLAQFFAIAMGAPDLLAKDGPHHDHFTIDFNPNGLPRLGPGLDDEGKVQGKSWCGIWAIHIWDAVLNEGAADDHKYSWSLTFGCPMLGPLKAGLPGTNKVKLLPFKLADVQPGDIVLMKDKNHHALVTALVKDASGATTGFATMNGNMGAVFPEGAVCAKFRSATPIPTGQAEDHLEYNGTIKDELQGYYRCPD